MKISAGAGFLDLAPPASVGGASAAASPAGEAFGDVVRRIGEDRGEASADKAVADRKGAADRGLNKDADVKADGARTVKSEDDRRDREEADAADADADADAAQSLSALDVLGRLLGGAGAVQEGGAPSSPAPTGAEGVRPQATPVLSLESAAEPAGNREGTTFDGALDERLVITPIGALSGGEAAGAAAGARGKGGVALEVLHMETHFEPRADAFVIVEEPGGGAGGPDASAPPASAASPALDGVLSTIRATRPGSRDAVVSSATLAATATAAKTALEAERTRGAESAVERSTRFDETLARLSAKEARSTDADGGERGGRKDGTSAGSRREGTDPDGADGKVVSLRASATVTANDTAAPTVLPAGAIATQLAGRVVDAFRSGGGASQAADRPAADTHLRLTAGGAALKTLTIQLQPENLGTLEVSMRLVEGTLTLEVAASEHATALALSHDKAGLKKLLEHAGFSMDDASISIVTRDATAAMTRAAASADAGATGGQSGQAAQGEAGRGSDASAGERGGFGREPGSGNREAPSGGTRPGAPDAEAPARRRSSVFL